MTLSRTDIINKLIDKFDYKSYLEVGTQNPNQNFDKIRVDDKVSIDPHPKGKVSFIGTSDEYFESISDDVKFDIIFIDGLHHSEQVDKDIENSLKHLSVGGSIVCHDCLPENEDMQKVPRETQVWTGDVWKSIAKLRVNNSNLTINVVDTDHGCGIIQKKNSKLYIPDGGEYLTYEYFNIYKNELLNVISVSEFLNWINCSD